MLCILQDIAVKETFLEERVRVGLHCIVGGLMYLLGCVIDIPKLHSHVEAVRSCMYRGVYLRMHICTYVYRTVVQVLLLTSNIKFLYTIRVRWFLKMYVYTGLRVLHIRAITCTCMHTYIMSSTHVATFCVIYMCKVHKFLANDNHPCHYSNYIKYNIAKKFKVEKFCGLYLH